MNRFAIGCLSAFALLSSPVAHANLVTNGGFESGSLSGWTQSGDISFSGVDGSLPHSGTFAAYFGPFAIGGIAQSLITIPGATYNIQFWIRDEPDATGVYTPNSFSLSWNGAALYTLTNATLPVYTLVSLNAVATAASTSLRFLFQDAPAFWDLDDIVVIAAVPEPDSLALIALAGTLLALRRRRR